MDSKGDSIKDSIDQKKGNYKFFGSALQDIEDDKESSEVASVSLSSDSQNDFVIKPNPQKKLSFVSID